jgi:Flagellar P-ring protein
MAIGCDAPSKKPKPTTQPRYVTLPPKHVPDFLHDTIMERCDWIDTEPKPISGFGLVARLHNTADNTLVPQSVRSYIVREMVKRGFGSKLQPGYEDMQPEDMLRSQSVSIVRVDGFIPPGARKGDRFDIQVAALPGTNTTSVAHGVLYRTEMKVNGAFVQDPGYAIDVVGFGEGPVFVNPEYALEAPTTQSDKAKASLRYGLIMNGGLCMDYRPLLLRLRQPQRSLARAIELLIEQRFASTRESPTDKISAAKDEGIVYVQVPPSFHGDWQHFAGIVSHMYLETRPGVIALKAKALVDEAQKPDAPLMDISYCWEAIGTPALEHIEPLLSSDQPDIRFAAARAAAYIGSDPAAVAALVNIAGTKDNPFQVNAIQTLGDLPSSPVTEAALRRLLDSDENTVRIEAYKVLASRNDPDMLSTDVQGKFVLDIVPSQGPPLIYATRHGTPRIAIIGAKPSMALPAMFTALDGELSISSVPKSHNVTIFYRGVDVQKPIKMVSYPDIAEIAARLGGVANSGDEQLNFCYSDIVAILGALSDARQIGSIVHGQRVPAAFVMEQAPSIQQDILTAPVIPDQGRPESNQAVGLNDSSNGKASQ